VNNILSLFDLLNQYYVEIPEVQRDYAHGRNDQHSVSVRKTLLNDIKKALEDNQILDLNFIYGKPVDNKFIPLDGQQRLTTLFLVYLYAYANDETKTPLLRKFTYKTRTSSRDFIDSLVMHRSEIFTGSAKPSDEISDSSWYLNAWDFDPTVQSIKVVLDDIKVIFGDIANLPKKLISEMRLIRFNFLSMNELGMEDSLYIKMNVRGRMLTSFENYKASLISQINNLATQGNLGI